jgi:SAM-dependent methyltransferase
MSNSHRLRRIPIKSVRSIFRAASRRARAKRAVLVRSLFHLTSETRILDVGSENGDAISEVLKGTAVRAENVYIADISPEAVARGSAKHGFRAVTLQEGCGLPFGDASFDIVYCSSVIEHVTVPKSEVWTVRSGTRFRRLSEESQAKFAAEIMRVGRCYFVQTPNRDFPIESHTWLPFVGWLPRPLMISTIRHANRFWIKKTAPDFHLLDRSEMAALFPHATIYTETYLGLAKSLIAVRR